MGYRFLENIEQQLYLRHQIELQVNLLDDTGKNMKHDFQHHSRDEKEINERHMQYKNDLLNYFQSPYRRNQYHITQDDCKDLKYLIKIHDNIHTYDIPIEIGEINHDDKTIGELKILMKDLSLQRKEIKYFTKPTKPKPIPKFIGMHCREQNCNLVEPILNIKEGLEKETSMDNEYKNYQKMLKTCPEKYNISLVTPVKDLCNDDYFVYEYIKGKQLKSLLGTHQDIINDYLSRIIQWAMEASFRGILIADINVGNFLYDEITDTIYAIDYGSIVESHDLIDKSWEIYHKCKTDEGIQDLVDTYCGGAQDAIVQFETFRKIIHHKQITPNMGHVTQDIKSMVFDVPSVMNIKGFDNIIALLRSQHMTLMLISMFNVQAELPDEFCSFML